MIWRVDWLSAHLRCRAESLGGELVPGQYNLHYYGVRSPHIPDDIRGLAKVESAEENRVVKELLGEALLVKISVTCHDVTCPRHAGGEVGWIGLQDFLNNDKFAWADGTSLGNYTNWANNQPDNNGQGQVRISCHVYYVTRDIMCSTVWSCDLMASGMMSSVAEKGPLCARGCPSALAWPCHVHVDTIIVLYCIVLYRLNAQLHLHIT